MDVWLPMLRDIDDETGKAAVIQLCSAGNFPPSISDIRETALILAEGDVVATSPWESWERALEGRVESNIEKRALKLIGGSWALKSDAKPGVTRSAYINAYTELCERDRRRRLAIPAIKALTERRRIEIEQSTSTSTSERKDVPMLPQSPTDAAGLQARKSEVSKLLDGYNLRKEMEKNGKE